jgi:hypothetical protein
VEVDAVHIRSAGQREEAVGHIAGSPAEDSVGKAAAHTVVEAGRMAPHLVAVVEDGSWLPRMQNEHTRARVVKLLFV